MDRASKESVLNVDPSLQIRLLDLQERDTRLAQLAHRRQTLPAAASLVEVSAALGRVQDEEIAAAVIASDLEREQDRADRDVATVVERLRRDRELLDSGSISDPKQLSSLQAEVESLLRRQSDLEDVELEIMDRVDGARAAVGVLAEQRAALATERDGLAAQVREQQAHIDAEAGAVGAERSSIAAEIPAELVGLYEKIRTDHGGVGAAPLHRGSCQGCHLALPPHEIEEIRSAPADAVLRCEECRRILVRTPESGL